MNVEFFNLIFFKIKLISMLQVDIIIFFSNIFFFCFLLISGFFSLNFWTLFLIAFNKKPIINSEKILNFLFLKFLGFLPIKNRFSKACVKKIIIIMIINLKITNFILLLIFFKTIPLCIRFFKQIFFIFFNTLKTIFCNKIKNLKFLLFNLKNTDSKIFKNFILKKNLNYNFSFILMICTPFDCYELFNVGTIILNSGLTEPTGIIVITGCTVAGVAISWYIIRRTLIFFSSSNSTNVSHEMNSQIQNNQQPGLNADHYIDNNGGNIGDNEDDNENDNEDDNENDNEDDNNDDKTTSNTDSTSSSSSINSNSSASNSENDENESMPESLFNLIELLFQLLCDFGDENNTLNSTIKTTDNFFSTSNDQTILRMLLNLKNFSWTILNYVLAGTKEIIKHLGFLNNDRIVFTLIFFILIFSTLPTLYSLKYRRLINNVLSRLWNIFYRLILERFIPPMIPLSRPLFSFNFLFGTSVITLFFYNRRAFFLFKTLYNRIVYRDIPTIVKIRNWRIKIGSRIIKQFQIFRSFYRRF